MHVHVCVSLIVYDVSLVLILILQGYVWQRPIDTQKSDHSPLLFALSVHFYHSGFVVVYIKLSSISLFPSSPLRSPSVPSSSIAPFTSLLL